MPDTKAGKRLLLGLPSQGIGLVALNTEGVIEAIAAIEAEAVAAERERIANLFVPFIHGEMFDETPESDLDLDATAFAVGERFRLLIGAYPYREADHA